MKHARYCVLIMAATLALPMLLGASLAPAWAEEVAEFVGQKQCKMCHNKTAEGAQWKVWEGMAHAKAFEMLKSDAALEAGKKVGLATPPSESADCLQCHVTSYVVDTKAIAKKISMEDGVQCESCHGPASFHLADGKKVMMKKDTSIDMSINITRPNVETCLKCHNDRNPTWDPEKYTLASGDKAGFDFEQAYAVIAHPNPKKAK